jgi:NAD(P)-dependent dehydrogenase (short-subunit alcohol dehydrogenase family)
MGELEDRVAVVAGGNRGFGRAIAEGFARAGAAVTVTGRTKSQLDDTVAAIEKAGGRALAVAADVTSREDTERVKRETEARFGPVSVLCHNAGVPWPFGPLWHVDPDEWWAAQEVHVRGAVLHINAFVPGMIERGGGHVIVVASGVGTAARPNLSGYAVAKATQIRLIEHLAAEGKANKLFAFVITPGNVLTELSDRTMSDPDAQKYIPDFVANLTRRKAAGEDPTPGFLRCAQLCVELASGRCNALTGRYLTPEDDLDALVRQAATV